MIIFDASFLVAYLHPNPEPAKDRNNQEVPKFRERVSHLVATLNASDQLIGVPTPALAEILVRAGKGRYKYLATIGDAYRFEVLSFDQRAAIDAGELIDKVKTEHKSQPLATWAKVKFDVQIAAIAKTADATIIYSDDRDIEAHGKRLNIPVKRICDLPLPPPPEPKPIDSGPVGTQIGMFPPPPPAIPFPDEVKSDESAKPPAVSGSGVQQSNELQADPAHPAPVQGSDSGRAQDEAAAKGRTTQTEAEKPS
jgi:predicted nucleic acid-binding protein